MKPSQTNQMFSTVKKGAIAMSEQQYGFLKEGNASIPMTIVCFGQGAGNIGNEFASFRNTNGTRTYDVIAVNTNKSDLTSLTNIPTENHIWFGKDDNGNDYKGFGKNAEEGTKRLRADKNAQKVLDDLIKERLGKAEVRNILFIACEGGGTGTSVMNEAVEKYYQRYRLSVREDARNKLLALRKNFIDKLGEADGTKAFEAKAEQLMHKLNEHVESELKKKRLSVLITVPNRSDGGDILRQVSNYAAELWEKALKPDYGIGNMIVVDNQHLEDEYNEQPNRKMDVWTYINQKVANLIHELNVGSSIGGTRMVLDGEDLQSLWYTGVGSLFIGKVQKPANQIVNETDIVEMFGEAAKKSYLHGKFNFMEQNIEDGKDTAKMMHHALVFAVVPDKERFDGVKFLPKAKDKLQELLYTSEKTRVFTGFIEDKSVTSVSVYVAYKIEGLPERLEVGLVKEYQEFEAKRKKVEYGSSSIKKIEQKQETSAFGSLNDLLAEVTPSDEAVVATLTDDFFAELDETVQEEKAEEIKKEKTVDELLADFEF